ncbi:MAG: hypothetical protein HKO66_07360 [Saprospiraceae bacterium]|nr:hypothetical protein [Bacteroidia bacterium]NNL92031.1 hypothetical protein [Saprospiraceae bacterium]
MKVKSKFKRSDMLPIINELIFAHRKFQEYLDVATASNNEAVNVEPLIEIRQFNIDCISKYSDLISESALNILPITTEKGIRFKAIEQNELMWEINIHLSKLIPIYTQALKSKLINSLTRLIIGRNLEKIMSLKDNLLHPIQYELFPAMG